MVGSRADLLGRMARGDEAAFELLLEHCEKRVYNRFLRVLGDPEEAADLTQETFLVLIRNPGAYRPERGPVDAYVFGIVRVLILKRLRRLRRQRGRQDAGQPPAPAHPLDDVLRREREERILEGIGRLAPARRRALLMKEVEGMSVAGVAQAMEMPENTVKSHLRRARLELRDWLKRS